MFFLGRGGGGGKGWEGTCSPRDSRSLNLVAVVVNGVKRPGLNFEIGSPQIDHHRHGWSAQERNTHRRWTWTHYRCQPLDTNSCTYHTQTIRERGGERERVRKWADVRPMEDAPVTMLPFLSQLFVSFCMFTWSSFFFCLFVFFLGWSLIRTSLIVYPVFGLIEIATAPLYLFLMNILMWVGNFWTKLGYFLCYIYRFS